MPTARIPEPGEYETDFASSWRNDPLGAIVTVVGEIDMETAPQLTEALFDAIVADEAGQDATSTPVFLDLRGVTFLASAGLAVLIGGQQQCHQAGRELIVVADQPQVLRVLRITELDATLTIRPELPGHLFPLWSQPTAMERATGA